LLELNFAVTSISGKNQRLDVFLSENIKELTRSQIQKAIEEGDVTVNGISSRSSYRLKEGDRVAVRTEISDKETVLVPENIPIKIIYQDDSVIVIDKPAGLVVHPGSGNTDHTLSNALVYHFPWIQKVGLSDRPGIVHRLDKETSGIMVIAANNEAYSVLTHQFKAREIKKVYLGLVWGSFIQDTGQFLWPIGRHSKYGDRMSIKTRKARSAETRFKVIRRFQNYSFLKIYPITGRTHQIRVHLAASGHPIVGDKSYGRKKVKTDCPRLFLHAYRLVFLHPSKKINMEFVSQLPDDLENFLVHLEKQDQRKLVEY
jgi:23S rRNA pseudouridine1911/1915/1917 synthase